MKRAVVASSVALGIALIVSGCGQRMANRIVAPQGATRAAALPGQAQYPNDPNIQIPPSSVPVPGEMHTNHLIYVGPDRHLSTAGNPSGYSPAQILTAYGIPANSGAGTIVIVDAFDDPYALSDFNGFAAQFGLPQETSTNVTASTNQVLQVVYASGRKPRYNSGWSQEEALDIEWSHALAPKAKIVLVETASNSGSNLYGGDDLAATISGAGQCSNSWGGGEYSGETGSDGHFNHAGVVYFFATGDRGGSQDYPAASPNVVAVCGTSLTLTGSNTRASETVWTGTGCGPSKYEPRPSFQNAVATIVGAARGIGDVAADADPNTGVAVMWNGSWYVFGGTSVATPLIAGIVNVSGSNRGSGPAEDAFVYGGLGGASFFDVTSGSAGSFSALAGYDFPSGVGAPIGTGGF